MSAVDEVKARLDIVDVVGGYVRLQKAGRYFKGLCPFHTEKTPSFVVYPERQSWHCFGACATGGDVIAFVLRKENLDFSGALRLLADRAGVELRNDGPRREEIKTLQDANEAAALFFHGLLQNPTGEPARFYIEERGLDAQAVRDFQIGFAPAGWDNLRNHLMGKGFAEAQLIDAGLIIEGERGPSTGSGRRTYDRFRERVMFPIRDDRGRVVGFGGRIMPAYQTGRPASDPSRTDQGPKYMNTPQTPIFDKGGVLYGLERSKDEIRRSQTAVIVEGYMDVIAAHQFGFRNVVASMGTAFTDKQAALVRRFVLPGEGRVVMAMDADEAGSAANLRAVQVVAAAPERPIRASTGRTVSRELDVRVLALPQGKDPDELIRTDAAAWPVAVEAARPVVDHLIAVLSAGLDLADPRDRSRLAAEVLPVIGEIRDPVLQAHHLQRLSRLARVSEDALRRQLPRRSRPARRPGSGQAGRASGESETEASDAPVPATVMRTLRAPREEYCLALLYREPALGELATALPDDLFSLSENRELFRRWLAGEPVAEEDSELWEQQQRISETRIAVTETAQLRVAFLDCVDRLQHARIKAVKEASALALAEGEAGVRPGQVASIARARLATGDAEEEAQVDDAAEIVASQFLDDMEAGLRLHRPVIEASRPDRTGQRSNQ